jgi:hypothetical protein
VLKLSKLKKNSSTAVSEKTEEKGVFYQAGEIIGSIGFHIVDGKDKVIGVIKKKLGKKQKPESKTGKISKKKSSGRSGKKITVGAKKTAKKSKPAKVVRKKTDKVKKLSKSDGEKS